MNMGKNQGPDRIDFVVGEEKCLQDIISESEIVPLLEGMIPSGACRALLMAPDGEILWSYGEGNARKTVTLELPLYLEGEVIGKIVVDGLQDQEKYIKGLSDLFADAVQTILINNLKRMLTTEIHTTVVNQSYEELFDANKKLKISEGKYRELAENLEKKVRERTEELKKSHAKLLQQEKMASIGQLAAGMAHEINNPLGFITSNLNTLNKYVTRFKEMLDFYQTTCRETGMKEGTLDLLDQKWKKLQLDFIMPDIDELVGQSNEGCNRIKKIINDLRGFSHIDEIGDVEVDLNQEIDRTLGVLAHQIPEDAVIIKKYGVLPLFTCNALICQVFLSIILNAVQIKPTGLTLSIETMHQEDTHTNVLRFTDNGPGMPPEILNRIFEPFFTTKDVGSGTGMGLATAFDIVTSYSGSIEAESIPRRGSEFIIKLPVTRL